MQPWNEGAAGKAGSPIPPVAAARLDYVPADQVVLVARNGGVTMEVKDSAGSIPIMRFNSSTTIIVPSTTCHSACIAGRH